jgi:hypothetical protein
LRSGVWRQGAACGSSADWSGPPPTHHPPSPGTRMGHAYSPHPTQAYSPKSRPFLWIHLSFSTFFACELEVLNLDLFVPDKRANHVATSLPSLATPHPSLAKPHLSKERHSRPLGKPHLSKERHSPP